MDKRITFLTKKNIDQKRLKKELREHYETLEISENKTILKNILDNFDSSYFTSLSSQEIQFLNSNSTEIWPEYLIFRYKFNIYPKEHRVANFPNYLLIEPASACNLRCTMCFQIDQSFSNNKNFMGMMDVELFKNIIDQAQKGGTKAITLASRGEPTLHPKLGEMLEYCSGKFFELKLNTHANNLTEKLIHQILKSDMTDLVFSVDAYTKDVYESIRVNGIFENVLKNIQKFKEIREKFYPNSKCATRISGVKVNSDLDSQKFKEFWEKYVDHVVLVEMEIRWDTYNNPIEIGGTGPCEYLWERMYIWYDGICNPCDADYKSELAVGSVKNNTISEIWNGEKYNQIRNAHKNGKRKSCFPCDRCPVGS